jgi:DNA helicase-2/ATP-dependent DNA helicase PcrA
MALDLSVLHPRQREAVTAPDDRLLVIAPPGAGKTLVLACRAAWLLDQRGASPVEASALTFTQKAGREVRERLRLMLGKDTGIFAGTFHSFAYRQLSAYGEPFGIRGRPTVYASDLERKGALARALREMGEDPSAWDLDNALAVISLARRRLLRPRDLEREDPRLAELMRSYQAVMRRAGAIDYDAMLLLAYLLLCEHPHAAAAMQASARHLLVDEAQDLEEAQWAIVWRLAPLTLYVVGDPLQNIYSWRGADPALLQAAASRCRVLDLGVSFRCPPRVLQAAGELVRGLPFADREQPTLAPEGPPIVLYYGRDSEEEAAFIAREIRRLLGQGIISCPAQVAVLFRANWQARGLEAALAQARLPYRVRGDYDLLSARETREALSLLTLAISPHDSQALATALLARPYRSPDLAHRLRYGDELGLPQLLAAPDLPPSARGAVAALAQAVQLLQAMQEAPAEAVMREAVRLAGYDPSRPPAVLAALLRLSASFPQQGPGGLLQELWLLHDELERGEEKGVSLLTIHAAKGLEWDVVFVTGLAADLLPHRRSLEERGEEALAEERRLLYVAMTRTRERLYLTTHRYRTSYDGSKVAAVPPSPFLRLLPPQLVEVRRSL